MLGDDRLPKRFWAKVEPVESGCWLWTASTFGGNRYACFYDSGRRRNRAGHAVAYEALVGPVPEGRELDHLCSTPRCVNPEHLEAVTHTENVLRGQGPSAQFARATHCIHGHPFAGENLFIDKHGHRLCRTCRRRWLAEYKARRRAREKTNG